MGSKGFQFAIDRGGTFTDVYARCPNGKIRVMKLLSVDPQNYDDAPREAIRRILQEVHCKVYLNFNRKVKIKMNESIILFSCIPHAAGERKREPSVNHSTFRQILVALHIEWWNSKPHCLDTRAKKQYKFK